MRRRDPTGALKSSACWQVCRALHASASGPASLAWAGHGWKGPVGQMRRFAEAACALTLRTAPEPTCHLLNGVQPSLALWQGSRTTRLTPSWLMHASMRAGKQSSAHCLLPRGCALASRTLAFDGSVCCSAVAQAAMQAQLRQPQRNNISRLLCSLKPPAVPHVSPHRLLRKLNYELDYADVKVGCCITPGCGAPVCIALRGMIGIPQWTPCMPCPTAVNAMARHVGVSVQGCEEVRQQLVPPEQSGHAQFCSFAGPHSTGA